MAADQKTVCFEKSNKLYNNPHKGFTSFQRFEGDRLNQNWTVKTGWKMEQLPNRENILACEEQMHPKTNIAYFRVPWCRIEKKQDQYDLAYLDEILETAAARGQKVMFRFPPHSSRPGCLDLPLWFRKKLGLKPREKGDKRSPDHPYFYERYGKLIRVLGEHLDADDRITAIDMSLLSAWGEQDGIEKVAEKDWKFLVDAYMQSFKTTPISAQFNHIPSIEYASTYRPVGARADCLGNMNWHMFALYPNFFDNSELWKKAPIAFEVCWVVKHWFDMGWDIDFIIEQSLKWHITSFNTKSVAIPQELMQKFEEWQKRMGYRFHIKSCSYSSKVKQGEKINIALEIENLGVAPIYHKYPLIIRLKGKQQNYEFESKEDITSWLPGSHSVKENICLPKDILKGEYLLEVALKKQEDIVYFATKTKEENGFYTVSDIITIS